MSRVPAVVYCILTLCAVAALCGLWFVPPDTIGYDICFSRRVLHLSCAGCGATRATYALLHGDFGEAFRLNALYVLMIPVLLYAWIAAGAVRIRRAAPVPPVRTPQHSGDSRRGGRVYRSEECVPFLTGRRRLCPDAPC